MKKPIKALPEPVSRKDFYSVVDDEKQGRIPYSARKMKLKRFGAKLTYVSRHVTPIR